MDAVFLLRRVLTASLAMCVFLWTAAAMLSSPEGAARAVYAELSTSSALCRQQLAACSQPVSAPFSYVLSTLPSSNVSAFSSLHDELSGLDQMVQFILRNLSEWLAERAQTVNLLVLLAVLRCCGLADGLELLAVFAAAALVDALSMRKIASLGFLPPLPGINFWLARIGAICLGFAAGVGIMPFSAAPQIMFWALAAALCCAAGWVRTFHRFH